MGTPGDVRIGVSGWQYDSWQGDFYPAGLPRRERLRYVAERMPTAELNGSFYSLQSPSSYAHWRDSVGENFVFAVKGGRYVSHFKRLRDARPALANFFSSGLLRLGDSLGPVLWQLPEQVQLDLDVLEEFLGQLPRTHAAVQALAAEHGPQVREADLSTAVPDRAVRYAFEVRSRSFDDDRFYELLAQYDVACVLADSAGRWPVLDRATTDFCYVRLHGHSTLYESRYSDRILAGWADRCRQWSTEGRDVYVYFDNDARGHAPHDALRLEGLLGTSLTARRG